MQPLEKTIAILGGAPRFAERLHVGRPNQGNRARINTLLNEILDRNWLTNHGPVLTEFETKLRQITQAKHCIAVSNATIGLELLIQSLGLKGEIIVPSWSFVATAHAVLRSGCTPIFCDVCPDTHCLDTDMLEKTIGSKTVAIMPVHLWGGTCDTEAIEAIADKHGLKVIYDAAHAFGTARNGTPVGNFGSAEVFSFHATKIVNAFEGGVIATNDDKLAEKLSLQTNFGFQDYDDVVSLGTNAKMSEISAAMGLVSLESLPDFIATNRRNWETYRARLDAIPGLNHFPYQKTDTPNYSYIIVEVDPEAYGVSRDRIVYALQAENIFARRYFFPGIHNMEPYRSDPKRFARHPLPVTNRLAENCFALPTGQATSKAAAETICDLLEAFPLFADKLNRITPILSERKQR